jgi:hypothetical protein
MDEPDEPNVLRRGVRDLPRKTFAFMVLVALLPALVVVFERGSQITFERARNGYGPSYAMGGPVPPWEWTADEWRKSWPWE